MKLKTILPVMAIAITQTAAAQSIGIKLENMNPTAKPGTDFYEYACGGWLKANPLGPEYARFGSFNTVDEENNRRSPSSKTSQAPSPRKSATSTPSAWTPSA